MPFPFRPMALCATSLSLLIAAAPQSALATVTVVADYHLGEADPGAVAGGVSTGTVDSSGNGNNLTAVGTPTYSADGTPYAAGPSTLSASFNGNSYFVGPTVTNASTNFGIEAWVKTSDVNQGSAITINGSGCCSGFGLVMGGGTFDTLYGGIVVEPIGAVADNQWQEIALVDQDGVTTTYLDGQATGSFPDGDPYPPNNPACCSPNLIMTIGGDGGNPPFDGLIDEVRVFTFADGAFNATTDLNVPEPASLSLFAAGLAGLVKLRRRG